MSSPFRKDRRLVGRHGVRLPLRVRLWKSAMPEQSAESVNVSQRGIYFATDSILRQGETIEVLFDMPELVIGEPTTEWRCTGHVVRVEAIEHATGKIGVGVQFDCYEVSRSTTIEAPVSTAVPGRVLSIVP
jgi:hypothetical protein